MDGGVIVYGESAFNPKLRQRTLAGLLTSIGDWNEKDGSNGLRNNTMPPIMMPTATRTEL